MAAWLCDIEMVFTLNKGNDSSSLELYSQISDSFYFHLEKYLSQREERDFMKAPHPGDHSDMRV